ncbi:MAG: S8 family serine peptidase [Bacteroidales bacterium]|jgi:hypothetical protein|nr:S8 family serine peptidase [Bacteroidales bacterium]MDD4215067.1 S8 family serine peptidase [Bacteroidales bacterium]
MKRIFFVLILMFFYLTTDAQYIVSKFRVTFTDKNNSPYSIDNPQEFLSQRAIDRRTKQNIPVSVDDLPVNAWYIDSLKNAGAIVLTVSKWFNCVTIQTTDINVMNKVLSFPFVIDVDSLAETSLKKGVKLKKHKDTMEGNLNYINNTPLLSSQPNIKMHENTTSYDYGNAYSQVHMIGTDYLHEQNYRGENMVIAVLDAGFFNVNSLRAFDSLWHNGQILGTKDFVEPGGDVFQRSTHGMMVLSIMGGNIPGELIGTAPKAKYWLLRSEDSDSEYPIEEDNWVVAAEFADSVGADIINSSLGYTDFYYDDWSYTYQNMDGQTARSTLGAKMASSRGILVVNSAGNSGNNDWFYIGAPADAENIITVGAVNSKGNISNFSSRGPTADGRLKPTVCAMGEGTYVSSSSGSITSGNGTSFSSPVIAGSMACLWQANPNKTNLQIIEAVIASGNRYLNPGPEYGFGVPNLMAANLILNGNSFQNFDKENNLTVFPNPFEETFQIIFYSSDTTAMDIFLYDMTGKVVYQKEKVLRTLGCNSINISAIGDLSKGYYTLKTITSNATYSTKIMKLK